MNHAISAPRSTASEKPLDLQSVLDVQPGDERDRQKSCRVWWYSSNGGTQSVLVDAHIVERLRPLVRSGHIARHMHGWLERARNQYQTPNQTALHIRPQTNWLRICGRTKSQVIAEILAGLADRLEKGEIGPASSSR